MKRIRSMVLVSSHQNSMEPGPFEVLQKFEEELKRLKLDDAVALSTITDIGGSPDTPLVIIYPEAVVYSPVSPDDVPYLVEEHLQHGRIAARLQVNPVEIDSQLAWLAARKGALPAQQRIVLRRVGLIDPLNIEDYILHDGYDALGQALKHNNPAALVNEIQISGLRGRGGAGFPTGLKWQYVRGAGAAGQKYIICNADESEPGTFKDRTILEGDPHSILEGMAIAAFAVGASKGYIYVRGEYGLAQERLLNAIPQAEARGFLGDNILGSDFSFHVELHSGAGAYICGEETALIESIEGKRGEPRSRPPFPITKGLWGKPTLVNNVETLANVAPIIRNGAQWYRKFGTASSAGTKIFTILGNINESKCIEVSMGVTLREVIAIYGQGMKDQTTFKLAQTGGSGGSIIPASLQDTPLDFDSFAANGVSLGSGALLICNEHTCIVDLAKTLMVFFKTESCGKCAPCRIGTRHMYEILGRISTGQAELSDLARLEKLCHTIRKGSFCGLGQTTPTPVLSALRHFADEFEAHVGAKTCPAAVCKQLFEYQAESV